jgi:hypothetical protein
LPAWSDGTGWADGGGWSDRIEESATMASSIDATKPVDGIDAVKSDLRANLAAAKSEIEALQSGSGLASGALDNKAINMQDQLLTRPLIKDCAEVIVEPVINDGELALDFELGNVFDVVLDANVTSLTLDHPPASGKSGSCLVYLTQDATGGRTVAWPGSVVWVGGGAPVMPSAPGEFLMASFLTRDGGTSWVGVVIGRPTGATPEDDVSGAYTPVEDDLGRLKRYTGAGHTWTIDALTSTGEVAVENDGSGSISIAAGTATLKGASSIPANKSAALRFFHGGAECKVLVEA